MTMETYDKGDFFGIVRQENRSENVSAESDNKSENEKSLPTDVEDFHGTRVTQIVGTEDIVPNRSTIVHEAVDPMDLDKEQENGIGHDVNETYGFTFRDSDSLPKKSNFETILHEAEPEDTYLDAQHHHRMQAPLSTHVLLSIREHESAVEQLAERIEARRANRTIVTQNTKFQFIERCKTISNVKYGTPSTKNMIRIEDLRTMHAQILSEIKNDERVNETWRGSLEFLGFHDQKKDLLMLVTRSIECTLRVNDEGDENWFPFFDFAFYDVRTVSRWPFLRNPPSIALFVVFIYYTLTPVLFCIIMDDEGVCPRDPTEKNREYYGTLSALYYASTTMSTVGYGDLSVQKGEDWRLLVAIIYMIISVLVAALAFSVAAETATTPFWGRYEKVIFDRLLGTPDNDEFLYQRTRRLIATTCSTIFIQVGSFVVLGVLIQRWFASDETKESQNWSWMTSYYWVVQTVTTIGYGDLDMSFDLRWFQVFYISFSTYFVGAAIGMIANLADDIKKARLQFAWNRREVSKGMIEDMQAYDHDTTIDQYEFCVASLLSLGLIKYDDIKPIMDKFRTLSEGKGFISLNDLPNPDAYGLQVDEQMDHPLDFFATSGSEKSNN